jgi:mono/diheme cytochrome c family protein
MRLGFSLEVVPLRLRHLFTAGALVFLSSSLSTAAITPHVVADSQLAAGKYIVLATGCNHCHTEGWEKSNGTLPEATWLKGGHAPPNIPTPALRPIAKGMSADAWVTLFHSPHPVEAMPWFNFRNLSDADLRAVHAFIASLP